MEPSIQFWESKRIKVVASHLILKIAHAGSLAMLIGGLFFMLITCSVEKVYSCFWFVFCWASTFNLWSRYAFVWQGESTLLTGTYRLRGAFQLSLWLTSLSSLLQAWVCSCGCPLNSLQFFQQYPWSVGTSMKPHTPISCASPRPEDNRASAGTWHPSSVQPAPWTCLASSRWANYASYLSQSCRSCMFKKFPCTRFFNMPSVSLIFLMYFFFSVCILKGVLVQPFSLYQPCIKNLYKAESCWGCVLQSWGKESHSQEGNNTETYLQYVVGQQRCIPLAPKTCKLFWPLQILIELFSPMKINHGDG